MKPIVLVSPTLSLSLFDYNSKWPKFYRQRGLPNKVAKLQTPSEHQQEQPRHLQTFSLGLLHDRGVAAAAAAAAAVVVVVVVAVVVAAAAGVS